MREPISIIVPIVELAKVELLVWIFTRLPKVWDEAVLR
jgi:hypothetical protein